jgi:hypothetical protein
VERVLEPRYVSRYPIPDSLLPCLVLPQEKAVRFEWRVYIAGIVPLRPTKMQKIIPAGVAGPPLNQCVQ